MNVLYTITSELIRAGARHVPALGRYNVQLHFARCIWLLILMAGFNRKVLNTPIYLQVAASAFVIVYSRLNSLKDQETDSSKNNGTEYRTRKEH